MSYLAAALVPSVEGLEAVERHNLRGDAVIIEALGCPLAPVQAKVPGRQADLIVGVGLLFGSVLEVRIVAQGTEVLTTVVVVIFDDLWSFLGDVARFGASFLS